MKKLLLFGFIMSIGMMSLAQWTQVNHAQLAGSPDDAKMVYTGTAIIKATQGGIFRSVDNGVNWQRSNSGLDTADIHIRDITYAQNKAWVSTSGSLYSSADHGLSWTKETLNGLYSGGWINEVAKKGNRVFVNYTFYEANKHMSIICYSDDGALWLYGDTLNDDTHDWWDLFPDNEYALFYTDQHEQYLFYSYDGIARDTFPINGLPANSEIKRRLFTIDSSGTTFLYYTGNEIYKYNFTLQVWEAKSTGITADFIFGAFSLGDVALACVYTMNPIPMITLYRTLDSANTWTPVLNPGISLPMFYGMMIKAGNNRIIGSELMDDLYYSDDNGETWTKNTTLMSLNYNKLEVLDNGDLLTIREGYGILKSTDNGATWAQYNANLPNMMGILYLTEDILYDGNNTLFALSPTDPDGPLSLYKSINAGANWTVVANAPDSSDMAFIAMVGNRIIMKFEDNGSTYQFTTDQGDTWHNMSPAIDVLPINRVLGFAGNTDTIFLFAEKFNHQKVIYISDNNGNTFTEASTGYPSGNTHYLTLHEWEWSMHPQAVAANNNLGLVVPFMDYDIYPHQIRYYRYNSGTSSWVQISPNGIVVPHNVKAGPLRHKGGIWYQATSIGVFASSDNCQTWGKIWDNQGLQMGMQINVLSLSGSRLFLGTNGTGIWRTQITTPAITTKPVTNITGTHASSGGIITAIGGMPFVKKGICYATLSNPTVIDNYVNAGVTFSSFDATMQNLTPGETYYVRAFIITPKDTIYGSQLTFTTTLPVSAAINPTSADYGLTNPADVLTTITWNDANHITGIVDDNMYILMPTDYNLIGNELWITQSFLSNVLLASGETVTLTINFDEGAPANFVITAQQTAINHAVINPTTVIYDITFANDVLTTITWNDASAVSSIVDNQTTPYTLTGGDFTITGNALQINNSYLSTVLNNIGESIGLTINFNTGNPAILLVEAIETISATLNPVAADFIINIPEDVKTTITWNDAMYITSVVDNQTIPYTLTTMDYDINNDTLIVFASYLATVIPNDSDVVVLTVGFDAGLAQALTITAVTAVGMENIAKNEFLVYPNPAKDILYIATELDNFDLKIFNVNGQKVLDENFSGQGVKTIDVAGFAEGVYFIMINNENISSSQRVVIIK